MPRITITVPEKNAQPYRFQLDRQVVTFGRGTENDIVLESGSASVHHAEMRRISGGYELRDLGSTNGIKLNGNRQEVIPLRNGALIHVGDVLFDFLLTDDEIQALSFEAAPESSPIVREPEMTVAVKLAPATPAAALPPIERAPVVVKPMPAPQRQIYAPAPSGNSFASNLMFLIFALLAFFAGLSVRFQKETGGQLIEAIKMKNATVVPAAAPAAPVAPVPEP